MRVFWLVLCPQMRWLRAQNWPHWSVLMYIHKLNSFPTAQKHLGWQRQAMALTDLQGAKWGPWRALRAPHMRFNEFVGVAHLEQGLFDPIPWRKTLETGRYCDLLNPPPSITSLTHCAGLGWVWTGTGREVGKRKLQNYRRFRPSLHCMLNNIA